MDADVLRADHERERAFASIHDCMPMILRPEDYDRWLGVEPDPSDLLRPFPAEPMTMWPISARVSRTNRGFPVSPECRCGPSSALDLAQAGG
jgi:putative SOS response-associated peptidase YedK